MIGRSQVNSGIDQSILDALGRQNTAPVVRAVLKLLSENYFNRIDDTLAIDRVEGLRELLSQFGGPSGVSWVSAPATPIPTVADGIVTIPEAASVLKVAGVEYEVAAFNLTTAITAEGKRKKAFVLIDVSAEAPLVYTLVVGPETAETEPFTDPVIPPNHFLVHGVEIGDGTAVVVTGFAKSVNGVFPDSSGNVTIEASGGVESVNGVAPDQNGNVEIEVIVAPVQTAGQSTTDVMSQKAVSDMFAAINLILGDGSNDADSVVDTVREMLTVFQNYQEGVDLATQLNEKIRLDSVLTGYLKAAVRSDVSAADTLLAALGKLEKKADDNYVDVTTRVFHCTATQLDNFFPIPLSGTFQIAQVTPVMNVGSLSYRIKYGTTLTTSRINLADINADLLALTTGQKAAYELQVIVSLVAGESYSTFILKGNLT